MEEKLEELRNLLYKYKEKDNKSLYKIYETFCNKTSDAKEAGKITKSDFDKLIIEATKIYKEVVIDLSKNKTNNTPKNEEEPKKQPKQDTKKYIFDFYPSASEGFSEKDQWGVDGSNQKFAAGDIVYILKNEYANEINKISRIGDYNNILTDDSLWNDVSDADQSLTYISGEVRKVYKYLTRQVGKSTASKDVDKIYNTEGLPDEIKVVDILIYTFGDQATPSKEIKAVPSKVVHTNYEMKRYFNNLVSKYNARELHTALNILYGFFDNCVYKIEDIKDLKDKTSKVHTYLFSGIINMKTNDGEIEKINSEEELFDILMNDAPETKYNIHFLYNKEDAENLRKVYLLKLEESKKEYSKVIRSKNDLPKPVDIYIERYLLHNPEE